MEHHQNQISKKLALYILLFSSLITLVLTGVQLLMDYRFGIDVIHQRLEQIENTSIDSFEQALWTLNNKSVDLQLQGLSKINDVVRVELIDIHGELVKSYTGVDGESFKNRRYPLYYLFRDQQNYLGTVVVYVTKAQLFQRLIDKTLVILMTQALKTFFVTLFIMALFQYLVTRHIHKISEFTRKISLTSDPEPLSLNRISGKTHTIDELDLLVNSINDMQGNLIKIYHNLLESKAEVANSDARFGTIFDSIDDAVVFADNDRKIIHVNRAFHNLFQYSDEELVGRTTQMIYANPDEYGVQGKSRYHVKGSLDDVYEVNYRRKDGSEFPSETRGVHVTTEDGVHIGFLGIIHDISEKIETQERNQYLQRQLLQAQKMESIGQLTGGIAHDFNNILSIVLGHTELAVSKYRSGDYESIGHYLNRINEAALRARDLVAKLLQFGRGTAVESVNLSINQVIEGSLKILKGSLPSSIKVITELSEDLPAISADSVQIEQVLLNLCINARDAMHSSGTLTLRTTLQLAEKQNCSACAAPIDGQFVVLEVCDTGSGIAPEIIDSLFEPFSSTKEKSLGGGLGLSVIHGILHQHGAHIRFSTKIDKGTCFYLYFPCSSSPYVDYSVDATDLPQSESLAVEESISSKQSGESHLLIVDDEEAILEILTEVISEDGYKVEGYLSPLLALTAFRGDPQGYNYLVTDNTMPEMTGVELVNAIHEINPDVPVIICSGNPDQIDSSLLSYPAQVRIMTKPIDIPQLMKQLRS